MNDPLPHIQKLQHQSQPHELELPLGQWRLRVDGRKSASSGRSRASALG